MSKAKCYKCNKFATGREHIPPISIFPEIKDLKEDFRKNLLTVPSCDDHNLKKSNDDEFLMICLAGIVGNNLIGYFQTKTKVRRALENKHEGFINKVIRDAEDLKYKTEKGVVFPLMKGKPDIGRLTKCIDHIACGIYYHEMHKQLKGETKTLFGFIDYKDDNINKLMVLLKDKFQVDSKDHPIKGANPKIFYYQILPRDNFGLIAIKMTFYEGTNIFTTIMDEHSQKPFDLQMKLMNAGVKTIIEFNGKKYEFN